MSLHLSDPRFKERQYLDELDSMTTEEREAVKRDKFGGNNPNHTIQETPDLLRTSMARLEEELELVQGNREAYDLADITCPDYVHSDSFRLMFLRSTEFNVKLAAIKVIKYWSRKVELFGTNRAFRKLTIHDLDEEDQVGLRLGGLRALPDRDASGRGILLSIRENWDNRRSHRNSMLRIVWYMLHVLVEDPEVQKKGIVALGVNNVPAYEITSIVDYKIFRVIWRDCNEVLPIRRRCAHMYWKSDIVFGLLKEIVLHFLGTKEMRARSCLYQGKIEDYFDALQAYGITSEMVPIAAGGTSDFDYEAWLDEQQRLN
mmetsp:Transcript_16402/g.23141  ORF Transcript_16402/g.23141 Transcript_16402/m.23141 type:complete len:316 (+) Transcript_16402:373-1320(+)